MDAYNIPLISVRIKEKSKNPIAVNGRSFVKDSIVFTGKSIEFVESLSQDEIDAIMAHELSHVFNRDFNTAVEWAACFLLALAGVYVYFNDTFVTAIVSLILILPFCFVLFYLSRRFEYRCDREAVFKTRNPESLKSALRKMALKSMENRGRPTVLQDLVLIVFAVIFSFAGDTHPSLIERFDNIDLAKQLMET
jgi:Zn-dependent protease with chaperone function